MESSAIASKVWSLCNPLRDDGVSYGDYLEQLTYLIFLKMADEYAKEPYNLDKSLADLDNLPAPDELAADIIENLQSALQSFSELQAQLKG